MINSTHSRFHLFEDKVSLCNVLAPFLGGSSLSALEGTAQFWRNVASSMFWEATYKHRFGTPPDAMRALASWKQRYMLDNFLRLVPGWRAAGIVRGRLPATFEIPGEADLRLVRCPAPPVSMPGIANNEISFRALRGDDCAAPLPEVVNLFLNHEVDIITWESALPESQGMGAISVCKSHIGMLECPAHSILPGVRVGITFGELLHRTHAQLADVIAQDEGYVTHFLFELAQVPNVEFAFDLDPAADDPLWWDDLFIDRAGDPLWWEGQLNRPIASILCQGFVPDPDLEGAK